MCFGVKEANLPQIALAAKLEQGAAVILHAHARCKWGASPRSTSKDIELNKFALGVPCCKSMMFWSLLGPRPYMAPLTKEVLLVIRFKF